ILSDDSIFSREGILKEFVLVCPSRSNPFVVILKERLITRLTDNKKANYGNGNIGKPKNINHPKTQSRLAERMANGAKRAPRKRKSGHARPRRSRCRTAQAPLGQNREELRL